jgi:hypothetical protein
VTTSAALLSVLRSHRFNEATEALLQAGIADALSSCGVPFEREVRLSAADRIDFMVGSIGLECKIDGSLPAVIRQLHRYAQFERVTELVLLTTRVRLARVPDAMNGKALSVVSTMGAFL